MTGSWPVIGDWDQLVAMVGPLLESPSLLGASIADLNPARDADGDLARQVVDGLAPALGSAPAPL
jgi:arginase family enzyme